MNKPEARELLNAKLTEYRSVPYSELAARIGQVDCFEVAGPSGVEYQVEIQLLWDGKPGGSIRVMGAIDDGGLRALLPISESLIVAPDGTFIG